MGPASPWVRALSIPALLACLATFASADTMQCTLFQAGDDERENSGGACAQEQDFVAGTTSTAMHLKVGGNSFGCDSEWATSAEFDLSEVPSGRPIYRATLIVHKTGYSDDAAGFAYIGAYPYAATGSAVAVPRAGLTPESALDALYPPASNVDLSFDVTAAVREWVADGEVRAGLLVAGVYSEAGYEDWISIGGAGYSMPPRLVVEYEGTVASETSSWSTVKGSYR